MPIYKTNGASEVCGHAIGILCLDEEHLPSPPGAVNNASSYDFTVIYKVVPGFTSAKVAAGNTDFLDALIEKARELEQEGVRGIMSNCGHAIRFQNDIANAVNIPVALSPLLLLPLIARSLNSDKAIGIITTVSPPASSEDIAAASINIPNPLAIYSLPNPFDSDDLPNADNTSETCYALDFEKTENGMADIARQLVDKHPNTGAIILENSSLPPYAKAVQDATNLPVFDATSLADFLFAAIHPKAYQGYM